MYILRLFDKIQIISSIILCCYEVNISLSKCQIILVLHKDIQKDINDYIIIECNK